VDDNQELIQYCRGMIAMIDRQAHEAKAPFYKILCDIQALRVDVRIAVPCDSPLLHSLLSAGKG
jgi:hypothetical protein